MTPYQRAEAVVKPFWYINSNSDPGRALITAIATAIQAASNMELNQKRFPVFLRDHIERQARFSEQTFGPATRKHGVIDHIRKELVELEATPLEVEEWIDVVILGLDGAWRAAAQNNPSLTPGELAGVVADALVAKQSKNERRRWPNWRTAEEGAAIEHVRGEHD